MAERLATVPEESTNGSPAGYMQDVAPLQPGRVPGLPAGRSLLIYCSSKGRVYRDRIRMVGVSGAQIRSTLFSNSQSGHSGSSYSSASNSYPSNNSCSSGSASATAPDLGAHELTMIARQMVNDGYTERVVEAFNVASPPTTAFMGFNQKFPFEYGGGPDRAALESWFSELDVDWVLQIREGYGLQHAVQLQDKPLQDLVEKWIRALTVIVVSITELVFVRDGTLAIAGFGKASIAKMLVFTDAIVPALKAENLRAVLDMYICVSNASYILRPFEMFPEARSIITEVGSSLAREGDRLNNAISRTMEKVRTLVEDDDLWAIEIPRGGGEVHRNTRFMVDCIVSMRKTHASTENSAPSHHTGNLRDLINATMEYPRDLLLRKSKLCSDESLRYLFLLNNSNFIANVLKPSFTLDDDLDLGSLRQKLKRDCEKHMDSYLDVSWGLVICCIPKSVFYRRLILRWSNTSSLADFESAFHKVYQAQKFWKVPEPRLRNLLRKSIAKRVISVYRNCLEENPELQKHVNAGSSTTPDALQEMLGELFEG